ncbi:hypothetical protein [Roseibium aggregatum]|jgi:hypothetical protein|uniref:Uncharacterized protein n=1 Tax=Roseibium aggregatum (strain ATCC 25650 / DSM 13394 / JCM 20685 / NBRC 16684 / NCIMB 2208 / IAM 12614 / B1) TaxID=384765 RepID=A0P1J3_ROSAI|nr:hypothetical protein [Roseibium aggregatum]EAV41144.1 hypothetical protein SIAM614_02006 [Stappia aggregata IAM 12614] [Roseibium aggregatum IAM 12614]
MYLLFFFGAIVYGAITLLFLILSSSELLDSGVSTPGRLFGVLVTSVFWPATLIAVSLALGFQNVSGRLHGTRQTVPLRLSHRSH